MAVNNASNFLLYGFNGFPEFKNPVPKVVSQSSSSTGNVDLYTVPAGKKVFIAQFFCWGRGTSVNCRLSINSGGTYYLLGTNAVSTTIQYLLPTFCLALAGEKIAYNLSAAATVNTRLSFWEFDDDTPIVRGALFTLANGDNTVYTCPAGKQAYPLSFHRDVGNNVGNTNTVNYWNGSGGTRAISFYYVPAGGSAATTNRTFTGSVSNNDGLLGINNSTTFPTLNAGDSFVINTDAATNTQVAWINVVERTL